MWLTIINGIRFPSVMKTPGVFMSVFMALASWRRLGARAASSRRFCVWLPLWELKMVWGGLKITSLAPWYPWSPYCWLNRLLGVSLFKGPVLLLYNFSSTIKDPKCKQEAFNWIGHYSSWNLQSHGCTWFCTYFQTYTDQLSLNSSCLPSVWAIFALAWHLQPTKLFFPMPHGTILPKNYASSDTR